MDKLRAIELFVRLADLGSFTAVANELNASKSTISKEMSRLEEDLGARLLHRTTRNLQLTHVGQGYLVRCRKILSELDEARCFVQGLQDRPKGKLRITVPMALGLTALAAMFAEFMRKYPEIELDIELNDGLVDLIEHGFDLGLRAASRPFDSSYIGRPITKFNYVIIASKDYLRSHPKINRPEDMSEHNCFIYSHFRGKNVWPINDGVTVNGTLRANNTMFMMEAIIKGLGIGFIPDFVCQDNIDSGEVVVVLPNVELPQLTLYALYPVRHYIPTTLKTCLDFIENWFAERPSLLAQP